MVSDMSFKDLRSETSKLDTVTRRPCCAAAVAQVASRAVAVAAPPRSSLHLTTTRAASHWLPRTWPRPPWGRGGWRWVRHPRLRRRCGATRCRWGWECTQSWFRFLMVCVPAAMLCVPVLMRLFLRWWVWWDAGTGGAGAWCGVDEGVRWMPSVGVVGLEHVGWEMELSC